ncbi:uncharacterized protein [Montipora capricornis]|uniref:uncharacterized protein n=1 Tax=Montipora foliosa TaxID=591990 RepID=UPI0035F15C0F
MAGALSVLQNKAIKGTPTFNDDGCPYKKLSQEPFIVEVKKCAAFQKDVCPFKNAKTIKECIAEFSKVPASHREGVAYEALLDVLKAFHSESKKVEKEVGECPALKTKDGCPFKTVKLSDGKPLVIPAEKLL